MINLQDAANGCFELLGGAFILFSIFKLVNDKKVYGVSWIHVLYFTLWGYWNLYYYPHLGQWWSLIGSIGVVVTNTLWVVLLVYYSRGRK